MVTSWLLLMLYMQSRPLLDRSIDEGHSTCFVGISDAPRVQLYPVSPTPLVKVGGLDVGGRGPLPTEPVVVAVDYGQEPWGKIGSITERSVHHS